MDFSNIDREDVFIGDINELTTDTKQKNTMACIGPFGLSVFGYIEEPEVKTYKKDAILIKVADGGYVDVEDIKTFLSCRKINRTLSKDGHGFTLGGIVMQDDTFLLRKGDHYVVRDTLRKYTELEENKCSYKSLKKINKRK